MGEAGLVRQEWEEADLGVRFHDPGWDEDGVRVSPLTSASQSLDSNHALYRWGRGEGGEGSYIPVG